MIDTIIIDRGHATLGKKGEYVTPGKQAVLPNGRHVYEGFENQRYAQVLASKAKVLGFNVEFTVDPTNPEDPSLYHRVLRANASKKAKTSLFVSLHNNAGGNGKGTGTEIFTSKGQTLSDKFAENMLIRIKEAYPERKIRADVSDGDLDKEENFYVIRKTSMPAVLCEFGFFDNPIDYDWLSDPCVINNLCDALMKGICDTLITLYGKDAFETRNF